MVRMEVGMVMVMVMVMVFVEEKWEEVTEWNMLHVQSLFGQELTLNLE